MNLSTKQITFLRDIHSSMNVDKTSGWRHHPFNGLSINEISSFIKLIGDDKVYLLIPFFVSSKSLSNARLRLSEPFLVNNKSNSVLITKFIMEQSIDENSLFYLLIEPSLILKIELNH